MSLAPHAAHLRGGHKMDDVAFTDTMIKDGLWDAFNGYHMGTTAENVAEKWQIGRDEQDSFAAASQAKAEAAQKAGRFAGEIAEVTVPHRKGDIVVEADEYPRHGTTAETLAKLRPAFARDGTVTAGNASGINDGAAALVLMTADEAARRGIAPMARIVSWATAGVDPALMGSGPIPASRKALEKAGWSVAELDLVESNEAFAAQSCAVSGSTWNGSTSMAGRSRSATRSAPRARGCSPPWCTRWRDAARARGSRRSVSAAAWGSPCASPGIERNIA